MLRKFFPSLYQTLQPTAANLDRDHTSWTQQATKTSTAKVMITVATKAEKSNYRYSDFYCFMTLADFTAYISVDDVEGDGGVSISHRYDSAA